MFNLTKRQLVCFGGGILVGLPLFFFLKSVGGVSTAAIVMVLSMLPFFLLAMYEKDGQPLEAVLNNALQTMFFRPKQRPYQTDNFYAILARQDALEKEIYNIAHKKPGRKTQGKKKAHPRREEADRSRH